MFRFTIRDVLWLTALVAVLLAWWLHYRQYSIWDHRGVMLDEHLRATGWDVRYNDDDWPELTPPAPDENRSPLPRR